MSRTAFNRVFWLLFAFIAPAACLGASCEKGPVAWWGFDEDSGDTAADRIGGAADGMLGNFYRAEGVAGKCLRFDGYTTRIRRDANSVPVLTDALTIEAWIAPQTYSWNYTAVVDQAGEKLPGSAGRQAGQELKQGLCGAKYEDSDFGRPSGTDTYENINSDWSGTYNDWSARWIGYLEAPYTGEITFKAEADNGLKLIVDEKVVIDGMGRDKARSGSASLEKGKKYPFELWYYQDGDPSYLRVYWSWDGRPFEIVDRKALYHSDEQVDYVKTELLGREGPSVQRQDRMSLGIDHRGHLVLKLMVDGSLRECVSGETVPLLKWSHIAGTFDSSKGIALYIDGKPAGSLEAAGSITPAKGYNLLIGKSQKMMPPANTERDSSKKLLSNMIFDGLIDEVKIYDRALTAAQVGGAFAAAGPRDDWPLKWRRMPSGPAGGADRFGAAYGRLRYADQWEDLWRVGSHPDILVRFDKSPVRLLFWRGTGYGAVWVAENGRFMGDQSLERVGGGSPWGCAEHMSDKQCRYSRVRIIENNDARVVVHWRYAISDITYAIFGADKDGWGEWADEYYYIYPDAVATRKQVLHSNHLRHEWQETIVLHQPGTRPEDNIDIEALTWANMDGESHTYSWAQRPKRGKALPDDPTIQVTNLKAGQRPFIIYEPQSELKLFTGCIVPERSHFPWWNHWPVAQLANDGRRTGVADRPAHSSLSQSIEDSPVIRHDPEKDTFTAVTLTGMTEKTAAALAPLARSWNRPPELEVVTGPFESGGYDRYQRAYVLKRTGPDRGALRFTLAASGDRPLVNPAFVIAGCRECPKYVRVNGRTLDRGAEFRCGVVKELAETRLVAWVKLESTEPVTFELVAGAGPQPPKQAKEPAGGRVRLPSGPPGPGRFGAYYETLKYEPSWDSLWKVADHADVVVRFDDFDHRFVFWRGTSYIPCWATYDGAWYTNEFFERRGRLGGCNSMCEPMSDKQCRYSHVRIIENSDARVVVHWRYSPIDLDYQHPYRDRMTGWGDWVDEYYTIYPDSIGVRKATIHTGSPQEHWIEYQESIVINQPGTIPEDNIKFDAVTYANLDGESRTFTWTEDGGPGFDGAPEQPCIQTVNFKASHRPFTVVEPEGVRISPYGGHGKNSHFNWWNHWPVAQEKSDTTVARSAEKPSHSSLSHIKFKQHSQDGISRTWIMLNGMTDKPAAELVPVAKSWLYPPDLKIGGAAGFINEGYDKTQRAYVLKSGTDATAGALKLALAASRDNPVVNPAFVIRNWGSSPVAVAVNGKKAEPGGGFRSGYNRTFEGTDLVVWVRAESTEPVEIVIWPVGGKRKVPRKSCCGH